MRFQPPRQLQRAARLRLHPDPQGLESLEQHPGIESGKGGTGGPQEGEHCRPSPGRSRRAPRPPSTLPWPSRYLVAEWITRSAPSSKGRCRAGVQKQLSTTSSAPVASGQTRKRLDIEHLRQRIRRCLEIQEPRVRTAAPLSMPDVGSVDVVGFDSELGKDGAEQLHRGAENPGRRHHMVAGLEQSHRSREDGRHPGSGRDARLRALPAPRAAPGTPSRWDW